MRHALALSANGTVDGDYSRHVMQQPGVRQSEWAGARRAMRFLVACGMRGLLAIDPEAITGDTVLGMRAVSHGTLTAVLHDFRSAGIGRAIDVKFRASRSIRSRLDVEVFGLLGRSPA